MSPTFNKGEGEQSMIIHDSNISQLSCGQNSSIIDESSITSVLYLRAKSVYKMKKIFNKYYLKRNFDKFLIRSFQRSDHISNPLILRLLLLRRILTRSLRLLNERIFSAFQSNFRTKEHQLKLI